MDDETFAFGSFRLIPAQRVLLDDGKPLRLGIAVWACMRMTLSDGGW